MPDYHDLDASKPEDRRTAERLLMIRTLLEGKRASTGVPGKTVDRTLLLATWNLREFGANKKYGHRLPESLRYLAEIVSAFDIVGLQEVNEDTSDLLKLMTRLGPGWDYLLTDITEGRAGNAERMAFVYDARKVRFTGLAGQVVIPPEVKKGGKTYTPRRQLARTPMMVGFQCGGFRFTICTAHIYYGEATGDEPTRIEEIKLLAEMLARRLASKHAWAPNMVLLGDFNIFRPEDQTAEAIRAAGFVLPPQLSGLKGLSGKHYDQIAFMSARYAKQQERQLKHAKAGLVWFFDKVFRDEDEPTYAEAMGEKYRRLDDAAKRTQYYRQWRTYQMSDHLPMWIELGTEFGRGELAGVVRGASVRSRP